MDEDDPALLLQLLAQDPEDRHAHACGPPEWAKGKQQLTEGCDMRIPMHVKQQNVRCQMAEHFSKRRLIVGGEACPLTVRQPGARAAVLHQAVLVAIAQDEPLLRGHATDGQGHLTNTSPRNSMAAYMQACVVISIYIYKYSDNIYNILITIMQLYINYTYELDLLYICVYIIICIYVISML